MLSKPCRLTLPANTIAKTATAMLAGEAYTAALSATSAAVAGADREQRFVAALASAEQRSENSSDETAGDADCGDHTEEPRGQRSFA